MNEKKVVFFGAGESGKILLKEALDSNWRIHYVVDNNPHINSSGKRLLGIEIISPARLQELILSDQVKVYISNRFFVDEIIEQLEGFHGDFEVYKFFETGHGLSISKPIQMTKEMLMQRRDNKILCSKFIFNESINATINGLKALQNGIIVLSQPKTGSMSLFNSFENQNLACYHTHALAYGNWISQDSYNVFAPPGKISYCADQMLKSALSFCISNNIGIKFISSVREAYSRMISSLFYSLDQLLIDQPYNDNLSTEQWLELIKSISSFYNNPRYVDLSTSWYDDAFLAMTGVNVYDTHFDHEKGYVIIERGNISVLLLRLENMNDLENEIGSFCGIENFKLIPSNLSESKAYKDAYKKFYECHTPPEYLIDTLYNSKYMKHFYTRSEIDSFRNKWLKIT